MTYKNYEECDIYAMLHRTREISKDPYKLFTATVLYGLLEMCEDENTESPIGLVFDTKEVSDLISECKEDFLSAISNGAKIDINGSSYTIRNSKNVSEEKIDKVFNLEDENGSTQICLSGMFNVTEEEQDFEERKKESYDDRTFFQKIIYLVETTEDGYDKLTDIEVADYCWALFHRKNLNYPTGCYMFGEYFDKYEKCFCQPMREIESCMRDNVRFPQRYFDFSARKMREWNKAHNQESVVDSVDEEKAADYWYNVASVGKFPLDK